MDCPERMTLQNWIVLVAALMVVAGCLWSRKRALAVWKRNVEDAGSTAERYPLLFDQSPKPAYVFDLETLLFLDVNEAALRHYGYSRQEFLTMTADRIRPPEELRLMSDEAYLMISELLPQVFPDHSGCLYAIKASRDVVEGVAQWGDYRAKESFSG